MKIILVTNTLILFSIMACVPPSQFKETQLENQDCQEERDLLISDNEKLTVENTEFRSNLEKKTKRY